MWVSVTDHIRLFPESGPLWASVTDQNPGRNHSFGEFCAAPGSGVRGCFPLWRRRRRRRTFSTPTRAATWRSWRSPHERSVLRGPPGPLFNSPRTSGDLSIPPKKGETEEGAGRIGKERRLGGQRRNVRRRESGVEVVMRILLHAVRRASGARLPLSVTLRARAKRAAETSPNG